MHDREWEGVINTARRLERIADNYDGDDRRDRLRTELDAVAARFAYRPADDVAAYALAALCSAWLAAIDAEQQDQDHRDLFGDDGGDASGTAE